MVLTIVQIGTSEHNREANDIRPDSTNYTNYRSPHWDVESQTSAATSRNPQALGKYNIKAMARYSTTFKMAIFFFIQKT